MLNVNSRRSFFSFSLAGVMVLLIALATGGWFFFKSPVKLVLSDVHPRSALFVSRLSPVTLSLLTNIDNLEAWEYREKLSQLKTSFLANTGIDYKKDIQPWLGNEITLSVSVLDIDYDAENGQQPGYLMALATNKPQKSREFLDVLFSRRVLEGANLTVEQYQGVKLLYDDFQSHQNSLAGAIVDGFVLFANDSKVLRDAINNVQAPDINLSSSPEYQKAVEELSPGTLGTAFLNLPMLAQWQGLEFGENIYNSELITLSLKPSGLLAETKFFTDLAITPPSAPLSDPMEALKYIPNTSGLVITGASLNNLPHSGLAQLWKQLKIDRRLSIMGKTIDPLEDIFNWVKGEYAIALLPGEQATNPHWIFAVERLEDVPTGIAHLDSIAISNGLSINTFNWNQEQISAWTQLTAGSKENDLRVTPTFEIRANLIGLHTTIGKYEVFASDWETLQPIITGEQTSLLNDGSFKNSVAAIPQPNQGYVYLDWIRSRRLLESELPILKLAAVLGKPWLKNLRSLTFSSYGNDPQTLQGAVFFQTLDSGL